MMMTEKWYVKLGDRREAISADLLKLLGFGSPYSNDESKTARDTDTPWDPSGPTKRIAEAVSAGLSGDEAALYAIGLQQVRKAEQSLVTAKQKVAELELKAASERRAAEGIALARQREALAQK